MAGKAAGKGTDGARASLERTQTPGKEIPMPHHEHQQSDVRALVERELSQMNWSGGISKMQLVHYFRMVPTVREMFEDQLPDKSFSSEQDLLQAIPDSAWQKLEEIIEHGIPESHYRQSKAAQFNDWGETPGFGRLPPEHEETTGGS
jgi:hypothetical protein